MISISILAGGMRACSFVTDGGRGGAVDFRRPRTIDYIKRQAEHHRKRSFEEEFLAFLKKHAIDYDPEYVWG
jgi:hypothetical protein